MILDLCMHCIFSRTWWCLQLHFCGVLQNPTMCKDDNHTFPVPKRQAVLFLDIPFMPLRIKILLTKYISEIKAHTAFPNTYQCLYCMTPHLVIVTCVNCSQALYLASQNTLCLVKSTFPRMFTCLTCSYHYYSFPQFSWTSCFLLDSWQRQ